jgi:hypothetical protein
MSFDSAARAPRELSGEEIDELNRRLDDEEAADDAYWRAYDRIADMTPPEDQDPAFLAEMASRMQGRW